MRIETLVLVLAGFFMFIAAAIISSRQYIANHRLRDELELWRREYRNTLREQQGMTFKFRKTGSRYIHTFCEGKLSYRLGGPQSIIGLALEDFIDDAKYVAYKESFYERAWQGEEVSYEGSLNGVWYIASLRPIFEKGHVCEVIASCVDITHQKQIEHELRESEQMYRLIAESSTDLIRILETDMTVRYASPSHLELLGYLPEELEGISCGELVAEEERDMVAEAFRDMVSRKVRHYHVNFHARHKNGTAIMFETQGRLVLDEQGEVTSVVVVSRDLTARIEAEEEAKRSAKLTLTGQLAAGIAHEIRNPLTAIKGFVQLLRTPSDRQVFYTDVVLTELTRVEAIVGELLMLAKPEVSQFHNQSLYTLITDVVTLLGPQATLQNVQIQLQLQPNDVYVHAVQSQLKQVFINIIKNAMEAMPSGGNVYITVETDTDGHCAVTQIRDEGVGISDDRLMRLGEPFYTTKERGTGLGLMVSHKIVKDHGGELAIHSLNGRGTSIEIKLPLSLGYPRKQSSLPEDYKDIRNRVTFPTHTHI